MRKLLILFQLFFIIPSGFSQNNFLPGEQLEYVIFYGPLNAGKFNASLVETRIFNKDVYHARLVARSIGLADKLFKVYDVYESYFNPESLETVKAIRDISEGKYKRYNEVVFDYEKGVVYSQKSGEVEVPSNIRDMVATFYYLRNIDFTHARHGDVVDFTTYFDDEIFPFDMRFRGRETIKTKMGTFDCIKLVPFVEPGRIFESEDDMTVWLSDDKNQIPVRIKFDLIVGSVKCDLIKHEGLKY